MNVKQFIRSFRNYNGYEEVYFINHDLGNSEELTRKTLEERIEEIGDYELNQITLVGGMILIHFWRRDE